MIRTAIAVVVVSAAIGTGLSKVLESDSSEFPTVKVAVGDPDVLASREKAQRTLADFLAKAFPPAAGTSSHSVKIALRDGATTEWVWVGQLRDIGSGRYAGLLGNRPVGVTGYREGQQVEFRREDIGDWLYRVGDRMAGGYSVCLLAARQNDPALMAKVKSAGFACA